MNAIDRRLTISFALASALLVLPAGARAENFMRKVFVEKPTELARGLERRFNEDIKYRELGVKAFDFKMFGNHVRAGVRTAVKLLKPNELNRYGRKHVKDRKEKGKDAHAARMEMRAFAGGNLSLNLGVAPVTIGATGEGVFTLWRSAFYEQDTTEASTLSDLATGGKALLKAVKGMNPVDYLGFDKAAQLAMNPGEVFAIQGYIDADAGVSAGWSTTYDINVAGHDLLSLNASAGVGARVGRKYLAEIRFERRDGNLMAVKIEEVKAKDRSVWLGGRAGMSGHFEQAVKEEVNVPSTVDMALKPVIKAAEKSVKDASQVVLAASYANNVTRTNKLNRLWDLGRDLIIGVTERMDRARSSAVSLSFKMFTLNVLHFVSKKALENGWVKTAAGKIEYWLSERSKEAASIFRREWGDGDRAVVRRLIGMKMPGRKEVGYHYSFELEAKKDKRTSEDVIRRFIVLGEALGANPEAEIGDLKDQARALKGKKTKRLIRVFLPEEALDLMRERHDYQYLVSDEMIEENFSYWFDKMEDVVTSRDKWAALADNFTGRGKTPWLRSAWEKESEWRDVLELLETDRNAQDFTDKATKYASITGRSLAVDSAGYAQLGQLKELVARLRAADLTGKPERVMSRFARGAKGLKLDGHWTLAAIAGALREALQTYGREFDPVLVDQMYLKGDHARIVYDREGGIPDSPDKLLTEAYEMHTLPPQ